MLFYFRWVRGGSYLGTGYLIAFLTVLLMCGISQAQTITWSAPLALNPYLNDDNGADDTKPSVATDNNGHWVSVWLGPEGITSSFSNTPEGPWSTPALVNSGTTFPLSGKNCAVVYAGSGKWLAAWVISKNPTTHHVYVAQSITNGASWSTPFSIANSTQYDDFDVASDGVGTVIIIYNKNLYRSSDYGISYSLQDTQRPTTESVVTGTRTAGNENGVWMQLTSSYEYAHNFATRNEFVTAYRSTDFGQTWTLQATVHSLLDNPRHGGLRPVTTITDVAAAGQQFAVAFNSSMEPFGAAYSIMVAGSTDDGLTWSSPIATNAIPNGTPYPRPTLAGNSSGKWIMTSSLPTVSPDKNHALLATRYDDITSTGIVQNLSDLEPDSDHRNPVALMASSGEPYIFFQRALPPEPVNWDWDIASVHGVDSTSWSALQMVNTTAFTDHPAIDDERQSVTTGEHGTVIAAWMAKSAKSSEVKLARSTDNGLTWTVEASLPGGENHTLRTTYGPMAYYSGDERWMVEWDDETGKIWGSISTDDGLSWTSATQLDASIFATDGASVFLKPAGPGTISRSNDGGRTWSAPITGQSRTTVHTGGNNWFRLTGTSLELDVSTDNAFTWQRIMVNLPPFYTQYFTNHNGTALAVIAEDDGQEHTKISTRISTDNGLTWSPETVVSTEADFWRATLTGTIQAACFGDNNWLMVWNDYPIYTAHLKYSISNDNGQTWSIPQRVNTDAEISTNTGQAFPNLTITSDRAIVAYQKWTSVDQAPDASGIDHDLFYVTLALPHQGSGVIDWQLY